MRWNMARTGSRCIAAPSHRAVPADLTGLMLSLATQAGMLLAPPPESDEQAPDLEGARVVISWLEAIKQKTEGRLSETEQRLLDDVLHQLRLAFVAVARGRQ